MVDTLRAAFALLTRLPVVPSGAASVPGGAGRTLAVGTGAAAFPLVGLVVGTCGAIAVLLLGPGEPVLAAVAAVAIAAVATGALHLDGLADTADALAAPDPVRAERARRDPSTGPAGVVALVLAIGAEVAAVASLAGHDARVAAAAVVAAATVGRTLPVLTGLVAAGWGRPGTAASGGFGAWFVERLRPVDGVIAVALAAAIVAAMTALGGAGLVAAGAAVGALTGAAATAVIVARRGGIDGDAFGASIVLGGLACLVATAWLA